MNSHRTSLRLPARVGSTASLIALAALVGACGSETPNGNEKDTSLFPVAVGNRWEFQVSDTNSAEETKVQTITGTISVDGVQAFIFETEGGTGTALNRTISAQRLDGTKLIRLSETTYDVDVLDQRFRYSPSALRVDTEQTTLGATYSSTHLEEELDAAGTIIPPALNIARTFTVEAVDESVTVPAGTFSCVRLRRDTVGGASKTYWFARGVGKVREVGGQIEVLAAYTLVEE